MKSFEFQVSSFELEIKSESPIISLRSRVPSPSGRALG